MANSNYMINSLSYNKIRTNIPIFILSFTLISPACKNPQVHQDSPLLVAAASDLVKVSEPLGKAFGRSGGWPVRFSFGASGQLEQQIRQGAPFDVFAPAARSFSESLERSGFLEGPARTFARGYLVAWSKSPATPSLANLTQDSVRRIAIANPRYAPYGRAAQQAFEAANLWDALQPKLVFADSVAHAFQMAETGNVEVALVALALVKDTGSPFLTIEPDLYDPIEQTAAVLKSSEHQQSARTFVEFLLTPEAQQILKEYGYGLP